MLEFQFICINIIKVLKLVSFCTCQNDTKIIRTSNQFQCFLYQKEKKQLIHWNSAVTKSYKQNAMVGNVHQAKRINCDFDYEISVITLQYIIAGYPPIFVTFVINTCTVKKRRPNNSTKNVS